jgi:hypothetical protein
MRCPRRFDDSSVFRVLAGEDSWMDRNGYPTCTYCGSLHPDALFEAIAEGRELGPTDKNYKVYVDLLEKEPTALCVVASTNFDPKDERYVRVADLSQPLYQLAVTSGNGRNPETTWVQFASRGPRVRAKFYFQHLSEKQRQQFVEMLNSRTMNIGYPGYFYRTPFFCKVEA